MIVKKIYDSTRDSKTIVMLFTPPRQTREGMLVDAVRVCSFPVHPVPLINLVSEVVTRLLRVSMNGRSSNGVPSIEIFTLYPLFTTDSMESQSLNKASFSL